MRVSIHQPEHMPWIGFFNKMSNVDVFVILDNVQYRKNYFQNRNRINGNKGEAIYLTVPLIKSKHEELINEKKISGDSWKIKYLNLIKANYLKTRYFKNYFVVLADIIHNQNHSLLELNLSLIKWLCLEFKIQTKLVLSSELDASGYKSDINLDICKKLNASEYLSGPNGKEYLDLVSFAKNNIDVNFHDYKHKIYPCVNYIPSLSSIDLLMNMGVDATSYI